MHFYDKVLNVFHSHFHCHYFEEQHTTRTCLLASAAHRGGPSGLCTTKLASKAQIFDPTSSPSVAAITQILVHEGEPIQYDQASCAANQLFLCLDPSTQGMSAKSQTTHQGRQELANEGLLLAWQTPHVLTFLSFLTS